MKALVIHNEAENFSVGANVGLALFAANVGLRPMIDDLIGQGQAVMKAMKYAPFPVVAAPSGMALAAAARPCCMPARCRRMPRPTWAWSRSASAWCRAGAAARRCWCATSRGRRIRRADAAVGAAFEAISLAKVAKSAAEARSSSSCDH